MKTKTILIATTIVTTGLLASCDLADSPAQKKLTPSEICDAICQLSLKEQQELQDKVNAKHEEHIKTGAKVSSD